MIYDELKKRELVANEKEYCEMVRCRQIQVNGVRIDSPSCQFKLDDVKTIKVGILEFEL